MSSTMQITEILLKNYRQFREFRLPLVDPESKQPLSKVCFIGSNATGKSTLLALISEFLKSGVPRPPNKIWDNLDRESIIGFKVKVETDEGYVISVKQHDKVRSNTYFLSAHADQKNSWSILWNAKKRFSDNPDLLTFLSDERLAKNELIEKIRLKPNGNDLAIYAPPDGSSLLKGGDLPNTNLSNALSLADNLPAFHVSSYDKIEEFWNFLIYQIKKRDSDFQQFLESPEAQSITVAEARKRFEAENPEILTKLADQWNLILAQAGLEFNVEQAKVPVQLNENLQAFIRLVSTKNDVPYNVLSTGIRNFIFRFGHIYTLYFNRPIERGFILLDEPESSLFPDLLYDIIGRYLSVIRNTQLFVVTHSPIIALQFQSFERFILEFEDDGYVTWKLGISPEGDDPNDLLRNDFVVRNLYGKKGIEQWKRFLNLRREIMETHNQEEKKALLDEYTAIGNAYNFALNEISE